MANHVEAVNLLRRPHPPEKLPAQQEVVTALSSGVERLLASGVTGRILIANIPAFKILPVRGAIRKLRKADGMFGTLCLWNPSILINGKLCHFILGNEGKLVHGSGGISI